MPDGHPIATPARSRASWLEVVTAGSPPPLAHVEAGQPCEIGGGGGQGHAVVDREGGQDQQPLQAGGSSHQRLRDRAGGEGIRITQEDREEAGRAACQGGGEDVERHCKVMPPKICAGRRVPLALRPPSALGASCLDLNRASPHLQYPTSKELSIGRVRFKAFGLDGHQINHSRLGPLRQGQLQCQMFCKPVLPSTASFFDPKEIYLAMGKTGSHHFHLTSLTFFYL